MIVAKYLYPTKGSELSKFNCKYFNLTKDSEYLVTKIHCGKDWNNKNKTLVYIEGVPDHSFNAEHFKFYEVTEDGKIRKHLYGECVSFWKRLTDLIKQ